MRARGRRLGLACVLAISVASTASAWEYFRFETLSITSTAVGFTKALITPAGQGQATVAICFLELSDVRYRMDGLDPTASVGALWPINTEKTFYQHDTLDVIRFIRTGAVSGSASCHYVR